MREKREKFRYYYKFYYIKFRYYYKFYFIIIVQFYFSWLLIKQIKNKMLSLNITKDSLNMN